MSDLKESQFEPFNCSYDYESDTVSVQFLGVFDAIKAWEYLKQSYPRFDGKEVVSFIEPSIFMGMQNYGEAVLKKID